MVFGFERPDRGCIGDLAERGIQEMYDAEYEQEVAEKFAKYGAFGRFVYAILNPDYFYSEDKIIK